MAHNQTELIFNFFNKNRKSLPFHELWNALADQVDWGTKDKYEALTSLFMNLVLDERFCLMLDGTWNIRTNLKPKEKIAKKNYPKQIIDLTKFKDLSTDQN